MSDITEEEKFNQERIRWPGSGSSPVGKTPWGLFDNDIQFQQSAPRAAAWAATNLGYPIQDVELIDVNFYSCFEEAILEYGSQVNQFNIRNNLSLLQGQPTNIDATQKYVTGTGLPFIINLAKAYGTETGTGGNVDWKRGVIDMTKGDQVYDLQALWGNTMESGSRIEIKKVFHEAPPASARIYDPFSMTGMSYSSLLGDMGFAGFSPATQFLMTPIFEDLLRMQGIEFNDMVRKSSYSFQLINNKIRIFPIPTYDTKLYFDYIVENDRNAQVMAYASGSVVGDYSNAPYGTITYSLINEPGKQWIRKYFFACCKAVLGLIRQKYQSIPIPGGDVTLDGAELRQEAIAEKEFLITQLRENLEATTRKQQMVDRTEEANQLTENLSKIPLGIYIK